MKFWKLSLITTLLFSACIIVFLYTACERNACDNVTCFNGGSCNVGTCRCPSGWEGPQCQTKSVTRYLGNYAGYTSCTPDGGSVLGAETFDSATITANPSAGVLDVIVTFKSIAPKVLLGYVNSNASTYSIIVTNNVVTSLDSNYYTITLQGDNTLSISYYQRHYSPTDTIISQCSFLSNIKY